jgi:hypothetical protein
MKGGIFNRPECCNQPCECPVCLENKPLMRLNCNHYVCLEDIQHIINSNPRRLQKCPICRELINNYGCNGNITNVPNNQQPNIIPYEEGYESPVGVADIYDGGKRKTNRTRKNNKRKLNKRKKTNRRRKISKRKTRRLAF